MIYYNRIRYKGTTPVIASSSVVNPKKAMYGNIPAIETVYSPTNPQYTLVNHIWCTMPDYYWGPYLYTGDSGYNLTGRFCWCEYEFRAMSRDEYITSTEGTATDPYIPADFSVKRISDLNLSIVPWYNKNYYTKQMAASSSYHIIFGWRDINNYYTFRWRDYDDSTAETTSDITTEDRYWSLKGKQFMIDLKKICFKSLKIWSDYTKTNLLFDGHAAIDENSKICVYDSVHDTLVYPQGMINNSGDYD